MSEISEDLAFDPKHFFPSFRVSNHDPESSTESEARVIGFGKDDLIFTPIVGGHLNFSTPEEDLDFPVKTKITHIRSLVFVLNPMKNVLLHSFLNCKTFIPGTK